jgi:hypothetical protein
MNRRVSSGDTLVSQRGGRTCGLPTSLIWFLQQTMSFGRPYRRHARRAVAGELMGEFPLAARVGC